jgi:hypothetical protein
MWRSRLSSTSTTMICLALVDIYQWQPEVLYVMYCIISQSSSYLQFFSCGGKVLKYGCQLERLTCVFLCFVVQLGDDVFIPTDEPHGSIEAWLNKKPIWFPISEMLPRYMWYLSPTSEWWHIAFQVVGILEIIVVILLFDLVKGYLGIVLWW